MKWTLWSSALLAVSVMGGSLTAPILIKTVRANDVYRSNWKPVVRIDPKLPVQIQFINEAGELVRYTLMGHTTARQIPPGKTAQLTKVPLPAYLAINPARDRLYMRYGISEKNNVVTIRIQRSNTSGDRAFEIDKTGAVYAY